MQSTIIFTADTLTFSKSGSYERPATIGNRIFVDTQHRAVREAKKERPPSGFYGVRDEQRIKQFSKYHTVEATERARRMQEDFEALIDADAFEPAPAKQPLRYPPQLPLADILEEDAVMIVEDAEDVCQKVTHKKKGKGAKVEMEDEDEVESDW